MEKLLEQQFKDSASNGFYHWELLKEAKKLEKMRKLNDKLQKQANKNV